MNVRKMYLWDLKKRDFAFTEARGEQMTAVCGQPLLFDGVVWGICLKGDVTVRINYEKYRLRARDMFVLLPEHIFTIMEQTCDAELKFILVSLDYMHGLPLIPDLEVLKNAGDRPCVTLSDENVGDVIALCGMIDRYNATSRQPEQITAPLFLSLVSLILSFFKGAGEENKKKVCSRQETLTRRFFDLMFKHYKTDRSVSFYADRLCVTPKYLSSNVKEVTGHPVQKWMTEIVIADVKRRLRTTDQSVQQISEELHFLTASSFIRFFRTHVGCTPLEYRKK